MSGEKSESVSGVNESLARRSFSWFSYPLRRREHQMNGVHILGLNFSSRNSHLADIL
jgi:hypothetical protein